MKILPFTTWEKIERLHVVMMACQADGNIMGLLEFNRHEEVAILFGRLGGAMRDRRPADDSDETMQAETNPERARRYAECGQSEASDLDF